MIDPTSSASIARWRSGAVTPRERLHRLLLESMTPAHLRRLLGDESLPQRAGSSAWFVWRVLPLVPLNSEVIGAAVPAAHPHITAAVSNLEPVELSGMSVLLEFIRPDGQVTVAALTQLVQSLRGELGDGVAVTGIFYGAPHLRPDPTLLLELSADAAAAERLTTDEALLTAMAPGGCPLAAVHTTHERVWGRPPPPPPKMPRMASLGGLLTGLVIAGVLAAIAIPNFVSMGYRAKRAETPANVDGIRTAELAYDAAFDTFIAQPTFVPESTPAKSQRSWPQGSRFDTLGWSPDGKVRGSYRVEVRDELGKPEVYDFVVTGIINIDGDHTVATYTAQKSINVVQTTPNRHY